MERVTFLIERTGDRISCLLNPESLEARRTAGLARRRMANGGVLGNPRSDDPLVPTGGGITEYDLQLLFDVDLANEGRSQHVAISPISQPLAEPPSVSAPPTEPGPPAEPPAAEQDPAPDPTLDPASEPDPAAAIELSAGESPDATEPVIVDPAETELPPVFTPPPPDPGLVADIRELTQPLWALAETGEPVDGALVQPRVRFIWGKSWNIPGVVLAVAERLECFDSDGVPRRSWLSLRLRRVEEDPDGPSAAPPPTLSTPQFQIDRGTDPAGGHRVQYLTVPVDGEGNVLLRHDQVAALLLGDPRRGLEICEANDIDDPFRGVEGNRIKVAAS